jgi:hypothetical protein
VGLLALLSKTPFPKNPSDEIKVFFSFLHLGYRDEHKVLFGFLHLDNTSDELSFC